MNILLWIFIIVVLVLVAILYSNHTIIGKWEAVNVTSLNSAEDFLSNLTSDDDSKLVGMLGNKDTRSQELNNALGNNIPYIIRKSSRGTTATGKTELKDIRSHMIAANRDYNVEIDMNYEEGWTIIAVYPETFKKLAIIRYSKDIGYGRHDRFRVIAHLSGLEHKNEQIQNFDGELSELVALLSGLGYTLVKVNGVN
jgi:hypothetical protein